MDYEFSKGVLKISNELTGKMKNVPALSTSPFCNKGCKKRSQVSGSICEKCYSIVANKCFPSLRKMLKHNSDLLSTILIPVDECPILNNQIFRFESHGDLINSKHLQNYVNICKRNPKVKFALWTKEIKLVESFFDKNSRPVNLVVVYSSLMLNQKLKLANYKHCDKIFTVYTKEYIKKNKVKINCGAKSCNSCRKCYSRNVDKYINEVKK